MPTQNATPRTIRWGILGLGHIAKKFANDIKLVPNSELVAVASRTESNAKAFAEQFGAKKYYSNYETMLAADGIDAVYIATTNETHTELTLLCFKYKISVLCEKPLALNTKQVQKMIAAARKHKVFFMEAMWSYFVPAFKTAVHHATVLKTLGEPLYVKADFGAYFPFDAKARHYNIEMGGGALLDIGIYVIALAQAIFGVPKKIQAHAQMNTETGVDEVCSMMFEHKNGFSQLSAAFTAKMPTQAWIFCTEGYIYLPEGFYHPNSYTIVKYDGRNKPIEETIEMPVEGFGYQFEIMEVCDCLRAGKLESSIMTHQNSIDFMKTMDTVRKKINLKFPNE